jgi:hypothetical protein
VAFAYKATRAPNPSASLFCAHIGTSDAYMSDAEIRQNPHIIHVAMAISAQTINYNLPGFDAAAVAFRDISLASESAAA